MLIVFRYRALVDKSTSFVTLCKYCHYYHYYYLVASGTKVFSLNYRSLVSITLSLIGLVVSSLIGQLPSEWTASSPICTQSCWCTPGLCHFPMYFILFINDLLASTSSNIRSFLIDTFLNSSFSFNPNNHAFTDISLHRNISASLLSDDFLARARGFFSSSHLLPIYKSQIRPSLECCSHVWGGAPKSTLCLLDKVQSKAIRLINNPNLTKSLQPLSHRRLVGDLSIYYRYFNGHRSQEIRDIIPVPLRRVRTTRSSTHSHPFQVSLPNPQTLSHKSLLEQAIYGTSCLLLAFLNPTTCHLSNLRWVNLLLIWTLSFLSFSLSPFFLCWGLV